MNEFEKCAGNGLEHELLVVSCCKNGTDSLISKQVFKSVVKMCVVLCEFLVSDHHIDLLIIFALITFDT